MELADLKVAAWLDRGPAHQLFRGVDGRLVYRILPTSNNELRREAQPRLQALVAALNEEGASVPDHSVGHTSATEGDDVLLSCDDIIGQPLTTLREPLPPVLALGLAARIARGLQPIHAAGLYHAAITADRLFLGEEEQLLIADTGMAMMTECDPDRRLAPSVPGFAELYPIPALIPPEVFNWKPLTSASDVFIIGALTYRWMTGTYAHTGARVMDVYSALRDGRRQPFPSLPANLNLAAIRLLEAALEPDPEARPTAAELVASLRPFAGIPLAPVTAKLDTERHYSDRFDQLSPEDAPGPPGSPAEQRRQEVLKRATLQLEVMKTQRDAGGSTGGARKGRRSGSSVWSWVLAGGLLVAIGVFTPMIMRQMESREGPPDTRATAKSPPGKTVRQDVNASRGNANAGMPNSGELLNGTPEAVDPIVKPAVGTEPGGLVVAPTPGPRLNIRRRQPEIEVHTPRFMEPMNLPVAQ